MEKLLEELNERFDEYQNIQLTINNDQNPDYYLYMGKAEAIGEAIDLIKEKLNQNIMKITKKQVLQLEADGNKYVRDWFPEVFKSFTGWAKTNTGGNEYYLMYFEKNIIQYGFNGFGNWCVNDKKEYNFNKEFEYEATSKQVKTALTNEAIKRGFKEGAWFKSLFGNGNVRCCNNDCELKKDGSFWICGSYVMKDGIWAEIIPTITKEEAEKKLNCKII
jgi:hypothetical protein